MIAIDRMGTPFPPRVWPFLPLRRRPNGRRIIVASKARGLARIVGELVSVRISDKTASSRKAPSAAGTPLSVHTIWGETVVRVIIEKNGSGGQSPRLRSFIAELVRRKPNCVLGLATGSTPLGVYQELIRMHREERLDFSLVTTSTSMNTSAWRPPIRRAIATSCSSNLFRPHQHRPLAARTCPTDWRWISRPLPAVRTPHQGCGRDRSADCWAIGTDGHIAFNEPGSSLGSRTRLKTLASETVRDNARFFGSEEEVPRLAVTMGVGTILESRRCLLLAFGDSQGRRRSRRRSKGLSPPRSRPPPCSYTAR